MKITSKFNIGDKVWFYLKDENKYMWGKVRQIDIEIIGDIKTISYQVANRFYKEDKYNYSGNLELYSQYTSAWFRNLFLEFEEEEVFESVKELSLGLKTKYFHKMEEMTELKKGWLK